MLDKVNIDKVNKWNDELSIYNNDIVIEASPNGESPNMSFRLNKTEIKELATQLIKFLKEK